MRPQVNPRYALKKMKERKKCPNLRMQSARGSFARQMRKLECYCNIPLSYIFKIFKEDDPFEDALRLD